MCLASVHFILKVDFCHMHHMQHNDIKLNEYPEVKYRSELFGCIRTIVQSLQFDTYSNGLNLNTKALCCSVTMDFLFENRFKGANVNRSLVYLFFTILSPVYCLFLSGIDMVGAGVQCKWEKMKM